METTQTGMDFLAKEAAQTAMKACIVRLQLDKYPADDAETICPIIRAKVREAMPQAWEDWKAAAETAQTLAGAISFMATMALAGIAAALEYESLLKESQ